MHIRKRDKRFFTIGYLVFVLILLYIFAVKKNVKVMIAEHPIFNPPTEQKFQMNARYNPLHIGSHKCSKWAVTVSTDTIPSEGVRRFIHNPTWCLVVARADNNKDYHVPSTVGQNVIVLDVEEQNKINSKFVSQLPLTIMGRKNVGYIYALAHGAKIVYDFDDKVELKFWLKNSLPQNRRISFDDFLSPKELKYHEPTESKAKKDCSVFNPYLFFDIKSNLPPRGFPLSCFDGKKDEYLELKTIQIDKERDVGLLQSVVENYNELDHSAPELKTNFVAQPFRIDQLSGVLLPRGVYSPFSIRSNIYYSSGLWAMYLPVTIDSSASDIWRACITKTLFDILGIHTGFTYRSLGWVRKKHSKLSSVKAEVYLKHKISSLLKSLEAFKNSLAIEKYENTPELILDLWRYIRNDGHVSESDVANVHGWLTFLVKIGYLFPNIIKQKVVRPMELKFVESNLNFNVGKFLGTKSIASKCESIKDISPKTFWTSDLHDGCRMDFPTTLSFLKQKIWVGGLKRNNFPHPKVLKSPGIKVSENLSPILRTYTTHSTGLTQSQILQNLDFYIKNPKDIKEVNAFFCQFPASMCELWIPMNKSIVFLPAHRYNLGRCDFNSWKLLNSKLMQLDKNKNIIGAISRYDVEYLDHYTNTNPLIFPSYSKFSFNGESYDPKNDRILLVGNEIAMERTFHGKYKHGVVPIKSVFKRYSLNNLTDSKAIVYFTYSVMSYKLTEFYSLAIPLFIPSLKFFQTVKEFGWDRTSTTYPYCNAVHNLRYFLPSAQSAHPYNPNEEKEDNFESEMYWLQYSDFYDWPHIQHFDSEEHLYDLIQKSDFKDISEKMKKEVELKKQILLNSWCSTIEMLDKIKH